MASGKLSGVKIAGIASAVPKKCSGVEDAGRFIDLEECRKIAADVGVRTRRTASPLICASDLCFTAAARLIRDLGWAPDEITGLIFVTQSPDYILPATSHTLHARLGLPRSCFAFDINLGCSGYVYGLWVAASLMQAMGGKVLLLVGDTISRMTSPQDASVVPLFGDAGTATALVSSPGAPPMFFELGADGSGVGSLIIPAGGFRRPRDESSAVRTQREGRNVRSDEDLFMDGPEIFAFALQRVPALTKAVLQQSGCALEDIDWFVFHQANRFMLRHLAKRIKIPPEKLVLAMEDYGNTSSASIPLAITASPMREALRTSGARLLLAGFGVGFSWAAAVVNCGSMICPEMMEYSAEAEG